MLRRKRTDRGRVRRPVARHRGWRLACVSALALVFSAAACTKRAERAAQSERTGSVDGSVVATAPRGQQTRTVAAASSGAGCAGAPSPKDWLTSAGCVSVLRCPGVPGPCAQSCLPFPKQCSQCATCECVSKALCGRGAAPICKGYEVMCAEP